VAERLAGKVALITGGASGIGRACAVRFAQEGARVCVADMNLDRAAETAHLVESAGGSAIAVQTDTTDEAACEAMAVRCVAAYGAVDILVAAAGISSARPPTEQGDAYTTLTIPTEQFRRVLDVNLYGVLFSDRAVANWLVAHKRPGSIINIASVAARFPLPSSAYSVSKAGVWMLTKVLAQELAPAGVRVNAIGPGWIDTPMTAGLQENEERMRWAMSLPSMGRIGQPEEVAATALFLASDDASYFTGELLHPSGGIFVG
jgi:NAD(P)-dependent dehydrogenase (short-subunit alcohol dehydrogenase family)